MQRIITAVCMALSAMTVMADQTVSLDGEWMFAMGEKPQQFTEKVTLPGSMLTNGKGRKVDTSTQWVGSLYDSSYFHNPYMAKYREADNIKFPFFLTPERHYVGDAWYVRECLIPKDWKKDDLLLILERPHITTTLYINDQLVGRDSSLSVPHVFDIKPYVKYGEANEICIKISNSIDNVCVGQDSHSVTDQTQGNWNGIVGDISLWRRSSKQVSDVQIFPSIADNSVTVKLATNVGKKKGNIILACIDPDGNKVVEKKVSTSDDTISVKLQLPGERRLWSEHNPQLYTLTITTDKDASCSYEFGMREISVNGRQMLLNGKPLYIRGTVGNCCFPETGYPPTDVESWLEIFNKCKEYGLNSMRFHSYCPPEAAFIAADRVGFYLQPEGPSWPNHGVKLGNGMSIDHYLLEETQRMVKAYGNHPSFCMLAAGNEPAGNWVDWVTRFCNYWRSTGDNRRIYCGASVGGGWAWDPASDYHVKGGARGLDWDNRAPQSNDDFYDNIISFTQKGRKPVTFEINEPFISHEQGQWCAFPDLDEIDQYTGVYKARNFEIFADLLRDNGMQSQAKKFLNASGNLQTLAYKYEIERNLRTLEYTGFQLLGLNDYSGQGTALVGVLNVHWREKGYCDSKQWSEFCAPVVPLAKFEKFVFADDETVTVPVDVYNALDTLNDVKVNIRLADSNATIGSSDIDIASLPLGKNKDVAEFKFDTSSIKAPAKLTLTVDVDNDAYANSNHWEIWVYPRSKALVDAGEVLITDTLGQREIEHLNNGGKVLLAAAGKVRYGEDVKQTYLPVFWNTSWFKMRPPHTTGAVIDTEHPLFDRFASDDWANLNWWELINKAQVMNLGRFPKDYQPPVQPIDTWHVSRKLGMIVEANVLNGKLLMTTIDIDANLDKRLVAREMRNAIISYMNSDDFKPSIKIEPDVISHLLTTPSTPVDMYTIESPDELKPVLE